MPPWTQKIRLPTTAAIGRQLKVLTKVFQALIVSLLLPESINYYIRRKSRRGG